MTVRSDSSFRIRLAVGMGFGVAFACAALMLIVSAVEEPLGGDLARWLAVAAVALAGIFGAVSGRDRAHRETGSAVRWIWVFAIGGLVLFLGQAVAIAITFGQSSQYELLLESIPLDVTGVFQLAALVGLTWPAGLEYHERRTLVADSAVGALGLGIVWVAIVLPARPALDSALGTVAIIGASAVEFAATVLVLVLAAAARRRDRLPISQVVLIQLSVLLYVGADVLAEVVPSARYGFATALTTTGFVLSALAFGLMALRSVNERETARSLWIRDVWSTLIPLSPVPIAAGVLLFTLVFGSDPSTGSAAAIALLLLVILAGVLWLRLGARAERRRAAVTVATTTFSQATDQAWFRTLIANSRDIVLVVDRRNLVVYASPSFCRHVGLAAEGLSGRMLAELVPQLTDAAIRDSQSFPERPAIPLEVALVDHSGGEHVIQFRVVPLTGMGAEGYVLSGHDVTDARRMRILLGETRRRDQFTGLLNADAFADAVEEARDWTEPRSLAVLVFELCDLRTLNDARGRKVGDTILKAVAQALEHVSGPIIAVGRLSFDGFAVLLRDQRPDVAVLDLYQWLHEALDPVPVPGETPVRVRLACGYSTSFADEPALDLVEEADLAATRSLASPGLPLIRYEHGMRESLLQQWDQVAALEHALEFGEFVPHYQPIVRLRDGAVVAIEALARRRLPDGGLQQPDDFIPLAEQVGLVARVDAAIRSAALTDIRELRQRWPRLSVSINVTPTVFRSGYAENLLLEVETAGVPPSAVSFEVTESTVAESADMARSVLGSLRRHGCSVALDDFGTGFSSLDLLRAMDVDILKIDQVFVEDLAVTPKSLAVMRAITELGRGLGMVTVAEGVRSVEQADLLRGMGCDRVQGFLYSEPLDRAQLERWLGDRPGAVAQNR